MILSESTTVLNRWATMTTVRFCFLRASVCHRLSSVSESSAEVASSSTSTGGLRRMARANATRCFSPPLSRRPRSPTSVLKPSGKRFMIVSYRQAPLAASTTSSSLASGLPYLMLYQIVSFRSTVSCGTTEITLRREASVMPSSGCLPMVIDPLVGS
mmetsp:Transcript_402/g.1070  ORF Transcript_402/g.1070 Transcript_402/m.1070 type:complete len:157 (-) Transcript_402:1758-2228(-)